MLAVMVEYIRMSQNEEVLIVSVFLLLGKGDLQFRRHIYFLGFKLSITIDVIIK